MDERKELLSWLALNKKTLAKYEEPWEVAHLARLNNFPMEIICAVLPHWDIERKGGASYPAREHFFVDRELNSLSLLRDSWWSLGQHLTKGVTFDDINR